MKQSAKDIVTRQNNARERFLNVLIEQHAFTREQAKTILKTYLKHKLVKLSPIDGQFKIKHGAFMEKDVLRNALNQ